MSNQCRNFLSEISYHLDYDSVIYVTVHRNYILLSYVKQQLKGRIEKYLKNTAAVWAWPAFQWVLSSYFKVWYYNSSHLWFRLHIILPRHRNLVIPFLSLIKSCGGTLKYISMWYYLLPSSKRGRKTKDCNISLLCS